MNIQGLKILVTGGLGFIGSHCVEDLVKKGASVRVYDDFSSGVLDNLKSVKDSVEIIRGNILDLDSLLRAAKGMEAISHQAAQLEIIRCIDNPKEDLRCNSEGTLNVLEAAKRSGISKVIYASSGCVYGQPVYTPQDELHPTVPNWPYGISKLAAEHYARLYHDYYGIETVGLRYSIVYGPREWYGRVLTVFLKRALRHEPPVIWGGFQERDFVFVEDVVSFHHLCLETNGPDAEIFNVSTGVATSIKALAHRVCDLFSLTEPIDENISEGESSNLIQGRKRLPAELKQMVLSPEKAKRKMNWSPKVSLDEGIGREFDWLKENVDRWKQMHY